MKHHVNGHSFSSQKEVSEYLKANNFRITNTQTIGPKQVLYSVTAEENTWKKIKECVHVIQVNKDFYNAALNSVPPVYLCDKHLNTYCIDRNEQGRRVANAFAMGEPLRINKQGQQEFYCFFEVKMNEQESNYYAGVSTLHECTSKTNPNQPAIIGTPDGIFMHVHDTQGQSYDYATKYSLTVKTFSL